MTVENELENVDEAEVAVEEAVTGQENEALSRELEAGKATIGRLEQALAARDGEIDELKRSLDDLKNQASVLDGDLARAVAAYRDLTLRTSPGVLSEFVTGDTIEAVNESLKNARALVDRVRREIEEEASQTRVPAGAPQRSSPDVSALSPREKIQRALGGLSS